MKENRIIELLTRRNANEASEEELDELNELLKTFPEAAQLEDAFNEIWNLGVKDENAELAYKRHKQRFEDEFESFNESDHLYKAHISKQKLKKRRYLISVAAILCSIVIGTYSMFTFSANKTKAEFFVQISTGKGIRKNITLPDGTKVWLNSDSKLSFDSSMNSNDFRRVTLTGEAFFDVAHNKDHPFIVTSNKISIRVIGTAFNVKDYPNDEKCETTLLRGSIELSLNQDAQRKFKLKPSEKFALIENPSNNASVKSTDKQDKAIATSLSIVNIEPVKVDDKEYYPETSWMDNKLIFENESLKDLIPRFERWFHVKIKINSNDALDYKFTGVFENENIEQALQAMRLIKPFNYKIDENEVMIY